MSGAFDPDRAASILAEAWRSGSFMKELPEAVRPQTMAPGYDIQDRLMTQMGLLSVGWKLGIGSHAQKRDFGVGRSVSGRIPANALYRNGDTVELPNAAPVTVEFEIAYVLGRDIVPDEPTFPVLDAVSETRVSFELVLSRFIDRRAVGWPSFAADNGACQAVVLGDAIEISDIPASRCCVSLLDADMSLPTNADSHAITSVTSPCFMVSWIWDSRTTDTLTPRSDSRRPARSDATRGFGWAGSK